MHSFFTAANAYCLFRALNNHVGCHRYDNFRRRCATLEASINRESKCVSEGTTDTRNTEEVGGREIILKMKLAVIKQQGFFFVIIVTDL